MNMLFANAAAEESAALSQALEGATTEEVVIASSLIGAALGTIVTLGILYVVLRAIANWKVFTKAGVAGWKSLIPFLAEYEEFKLCWKGSYGLITAILLAVVNYITSSVNNPANWMIAVAAILGIIALVFSCMQSLRLSRAFGKSRLFGVGLFLLGPIFRLILGFGGARYAGHPDR